MLRLLSLSSLSDNTLSLLDFSVSNDDIITEAITLNKLNESCPSKALFDNKLNPNIYFLFRIPSARRCTSHLLKYLKDVSCLCELS